MQVKKHCRKTYKKKQCLEDSLTIKSSRWEKSVNVANPSIALRFFPVIKRKTTTQNLHFNFCQKYFFND